MDTFWMCWVEGRLGPTRQHETLTDAKHEAERLARLPENEDRHVFVLAAVYACQAQEIPVLWDDCAHELETQGIRRPT